MSNTIKVKRGAAAPTTSNLEEYELGYSTNEKNLYIRDNSEIVPINKNQLIFYFPSSMGSGTMQLPTWKFATHSDYYYIDDYPYRAEIYWQEARYLDIPIVIFHPMSGFDMNFKVASDNQIIYIYSEEIPKQDLHINQIILMRG